MRIHWKRSSGQPTRRDPPAVRFGGMLTIPQRKKYDVTKPCKRPQTKRVSFNKMLQQDISSVLQKTLRFEWPLWQTATRSNNEGWLIHKINGDKPKYSQFTRGCKGPFLTPISLETKAPQSLLYGPMGVRHSQPSGYLNNDGTFQQYEWINQNPLDSCEYRSEFSSRKSKGAPREEAAGLQHPKPPKLKFIKHRFYRYYTKKFFPFSCNEPLKWADE
jgi:hypothetical protein